MQVGNTGMICRTSWGGVLRPCMPSDDRRCGITHCPGSLGKRRYSAVQLSTGTD